MMTYDELEEQLETEIDRWVEIHLAEAPELGEAVLAALRQTLDGSAPE
jgi:hypothetical protein